MRHTVEKYDDVVYATGLDDALVGHAGHYCGKDGQQMVAVYSRRKLIAHFMADGASYEEAEEHIGFNIEGAYTHPGMPVFLLDDLED